MNISVVVVGAAGRMGREVVRAIVEADGLELAAAVDTHEIGTDAGSLAGVAVTLAVAAFTAPRESLFGICAVSLVIVARHHGNIGRLLRRQER